MMRTFVIFLFVLAICQADCMSKNKKKREVDLIYRLPSDVIIPTGYNLHLTPDLGNSSFDAEVNITLIALNTSDTFTLNLKDLTLYNVTFVDLNTTETLENKYLEVPEDEILKITITPKFEKDHHYSLRIIYEGILGEHARGFYRSEIKQGDQVTGYMAMTLFEPTYAREAFPCWDEPIFKAKFNISLTHNKTFQALSNTDVLKIEEKDGIMTTWFKETPPISTYLVAFAVSDYPFKKDEVGNFTYRVWAKNDTINQTDYAFKMSRKLLEQLNLYTNISYQTYMPDKIDQFVLTEFPVNAMENWGLVVYSEEHFLYNETSHVTKDKLDVLLTVAHEFAHQWFGDLISPKWWKYIWLNEGFSHYFQYFLTHKILPELRLNETFVVESVQQVAMHMDGYPVTRPLNKDVTNTDEINGLFDSIAYQKGKVISTSTVNTNNYLYAGASIIRMISHAMTEQVFHKGLKYYLTSHALGSVDSDDLIKSFQKALNESEIKWKQPIDVVLHNYTECQGYAALTARRIKGGYELTQQQFVTVLLKIEDYLTKWWLPITYVEESKPDFTNTTPVAWLSPENASLTMPSNEKTGWFVFNTQQTGYYRVNYEIENWELLTKELGKGNDSKIHVLNRAQLLDDAFNLARGDNLNYTIAMNLSLYLTNETDYVPWRPGFRHLSFLQNLLRTSKHYYVFMRYVAYLMRGLTKAVGFEPKENDSDLIKILRVDAMKFACVAGVKNCTDYAEKTYQEWLKNPQMKLDINLKTEILCAGVRKANSTAWAKTLEHLNASMSDKDDRRKDQLMALACSNSSQILKNYLNSTIDPTYPVDFKTAAIDIIARYPGGTQLVFDFLRNEYNRIKHIANFMTIVTDVAIAIGGGVTLEDQHLDLGAFLLEKDLTESIEYALIQSTANMFWILDYQPTVDAWLSDSNYLFETNSASSLPVATSLVMLSLYFTNARF